FQLKPRRHIQKEEPIQVHRHQGEKRIDDGCDKDYPNEVETTFQQQIRLQLGRDFLWQVFEQHSSSRLHEGEKG
ncbi:MAG: hypothetical protein QF437_20860, partial [Planctomycetota bacterium]|nr:hypothetical protein [Planctomycetota bacterium]